MEKQLHSSPRIKDLAKDDRPREKFLQKGIESLSNSELLAILLNDGHIEKSAVDLAKETLELGKGNLNELGKCSLEMLCSVKGIGLVKAIRIMATFEIARRRQAEMSLIKRSITSSQEMALYLRSMLKDYPYEVFAVLFLNQANKIKSFEVISKGGLTGTVADPRVIFSRALREGATSIVLSHNHPSGNLRPSRADEELTQKLRNAASFLDIRVLDHIIVSEEGYYSFADEGLL